VATVGGAAWPPVLRARPLRFIFSTYNRPMFWLSERQRSGASRELKGKRVGVSGIGSGPDFSAARGLRGTRSRGRDVAILAWSHPTIYSGLQSGVVDAAMLSAVYFQAKRMGFAS